MVTSTHDNGPAGNVYDKYGTSNPIARLLMANYMRSFDRLAAQARATQAHEVGCGEGELSLRLAKTVATVKGSDVSGDIIDIARRDAERTAVADRATFQVRSVYDLDPEEDSAEMIVCCEVFEHLEDPDRALEVLADLARPYLLTSVPREPLWRALNLSRFKYVRDLGNTPGHVQHWSTGAFRRFLGRRFSVITLATPLPWTMALCRKL